MADLSWPEKRKFEQLFEMGGGYVLDFSNRTFSEFFMDTVGREIFDATYSYSSGSKANRLRAFWTAEPNHVVAKVVTALIDHAQDLGRSPQDPQLFESCRQIAARLERGSPLDGLQALTPETDERDFEIVAGQVRDVIEKNQPEAGLDRLHTFTVKFVRTLCEAHGVVVTKEKPLHSLIGEYVKRIRAEGHLESEMGVRILKSSISVLEAFNDVRNNQSLAHDNAILNREESMLIFNHIAALIRFLRGLEARIEKAKAATRPRLSLDDEIPF